MKFSDILSFFIILKESIKLVSINGKFTASILSLSLILPSTLLLSFFDFFRFLEAGSYPPESELKYLYLFFAVQIIFVLVFCAISHVLGTATILVSSASYTGCDLSWEELFTGIKRTWKKPLSASFRLCRHWTSYLSFVLFLGVILAVMSPNVFTIFGAIIIAVVVFVFQMYASVVQVLSCVVSVLDENLEGEAMERAGNLVKGHQLKGFLLNVFFNLVFLVVFGLLWVMVLNRYVGVMAYLLWFVNLFSILKMALFMAYTVFYFQCKKDCGEEMKNLQGNVEYAKLATTVVGADIP